MVLPILIVQYMLTGLEVLNSSRGSEDFIFHFSLPDIYGTVLVIDKEKATE